MKYARHTFFILFMACAMLFSLGCSSDSEKGPAESKSNQAPKKQFLAFGGGPTGGTFNFFANKMANIISVAYGNIDVSPKGSGGSAENLRTLNKNGIDVGIVYSGDAFLRRNGKLPGDTVRYDQIQAMSFLYGAPAQLVVRADSGINSAMDLEGKIVAIGNPGSGAALSAERFFKHLKLWDKIDHRNLGYSQAASDFSNKAIDAFWVLVGYPNSSIIEAASRTKVKLLDLHQDAVASGFYEVYPFYSQVNIPAGVYDNQDVDVSTFQDASLWCASAKLSEQTVYDCLKAVYSAQGLKDMVAAHKAAKNMSLENGIEGVSIPLHPGAYRFWKEQGVEVPPRLVP